MGTMNNEQDAFEQKLRESLDQFEVPYNSSDWAQLERALNGTSAVSRWRHGRTISAVVAGALLIGAGAWYLGSKGVVAPEESPVATNTEKTVVEDRQTADPTSGAAKRSGETEATTSEAGSTSSPDGDKPQQTSGKEEMERNGSTTSENAAPIGPLTTKAHSTGSSAEQDKTTSATGDTPEHSTKSTFTASVSEACAGASVDFKVSNMPEGGIYLWNFGDGSFSNKANPEHTFTKPGSYQVMLSMSAAGVGTIQNKPSSDVIVIHESPKAEFNVLKQEYDGHLPSVHFENRSMGGKKYHWDFGDGQTSSIPHPDHIYKKKGVYKVELTVTNEIGCEDKSMRDVRIDKDYNLDAPAEFSPNGDGQDETFIPEALRSLGVKFNLMIYSANGSLLYQTNDATKPWTGRPSNRGDVCGAGEYVWVVDVRESLHLGETYTGKVRLER